MRLFRRTATYFVTFTEAPGVAPGTPVRRSGVRIGEVADVQLDDESGKVKVTLGIDKHFTIRENETPTLSTSVIGGDSVIDFVPKKQDIKQPPLDRSPVPEGSTIAGETQATVGSLLTKASEVVPTTQDLMNDIRKSLQALEKMAPNVDATMKEFRDLAAETRTLVPEVKKTNAQDPGFRQIGAGRDAGREEDGGRVAQGGDGLRRRRSRTPRDEPRAAKAHQVGQRRLSRSAPDQS